MRSRSSEILKTGSGPPSRKFLLGIAGAGVAAVVGTAGIAAAQTGQNPSQFPVTKADCVNWQTFGFKNHGQCVSWWEHHVAGHGYGNGNGNTVDTEVNLDVKGNDNIIRTVFHIIIG